ncbi:hypothetical protein J6590_002490 [Homalodisca vitripennis]|nr:hypothetical protein J6590_002490 [Homalodisca vitripennis]
MSRKLTYTRRSRRTIKVGRPIVSYWSQGHIETSSELVLSPVCRRSADRIHHTRQYRRQSSIDWTAAAGNPAISPIN